ncbi:hypothetical protein OIV83_005295 [Microbotryomycetes sp. JL201]|nr:hypothetical protein OIV83_005295 [Microbotryomycetes sp. JL201]
MSVAQIPQDRLIQGTVAADIAKRYDFQDKLKPLASNPKLLADRFESFIGALYLEQGSNAVSAFLTPLFRDALAESGLVPIPQPTTMTLSVSQGPLPSAFGPKMTMKAKRVARKIQAKAEKAAAIRTKQLAAEANTGFAASKACAKQKASPIKYEPLEYPSLQAAAGSFVNDLKAKSYLQYYRKTANRHSFSPPGYRPVGLPRKSPASEKTVTALLLLAVEAGSVKIESGTR